MKGLELSKEYFYEIGLPEFKSKCADIFDELAFGLVGEGSECLGFDDELSIDHDFGPGFCVWVPEAVYEVHGKKLWNTYESLSKEYKGYKRTDSKYALGRIGILTNEGFLKRFTNQKTLPDTNMKWLSIPSSYLCNMVNGEVFLDNKGAITKYRDFFKAFYPEDVIKKKLAASCVHMAQSGQYNFYRCIKRQDYYAAFLAKSEFIKAALDVVFLLNNEYIPFYKWVFKKADSLCILKPAIQKIKQLTDEKENSEFLIEEICKDIASELKIRGYTTSCDSFLQIHAEEIMEGIKDPGIKALHILANA